MRFFLIILLSLYSAPTVSMERDRILAHITQAMWHFTIKATPTPSPRYTYDQTRAMEHPKFEITEQIAQEHYVDQKTQQLIDEKLTHTLTCGANEFSWLPGFILKSDPSRVVGALKIREVAHEKNLCVSAPVKKLYKHKCLENTFYTVAKKIEPHNKPFNLIQIQHLYKVVQITRFQDVNPENFLNGKDGIAYCIDTSEDSFSADPNYYTNGFLRAIDRLSILKLDQNAKQWIEQKLEKKIKNLDKKTDFEV